MADLPHQTSPLRGNLSEGKKGKPFLVLAFAFRRAPLILLLGGVLAAFLLFVLLPRVKTLYSTDGLLLIDPSKEMTVSGRERDPFPGVFRDFTRTMVQRLTAIDLLSEAVQRLQPDQYPSFLVPTDPPQVNAFRLQAHIDVREVPQTYLVSVVITAPQPHGLAEVLNHVMQAFVDKVQHEQQSKQLRRINYLTLERDKILGRLEESQALLLKPNPDLIEGAVLHEGYTAHVSKLDKIQQLYLDAEVRRSEAHILYEQAVANLTELSQLDLQPLANQRVADNFGITRMELWTYEQTAELRKSIDGLTVDNQDRKNVEARIQAMEDYLYNYKIRVAEQTIDQLQSTRLFGFTEELIRATNADEAAAKQVDYLQGLLSEAAQEHHRVAQGVYEASGLQYTIDQLRERLQALNSRIDDAEMEAMAPVQIYIDKMALKPGGPGSTNAKALAVMSFLLGFGGAFGFILVFDFVDNRLRDPKEVNSALGGPGAGPIPILEGPEHPPGSFAEVTLEWPRHPTALAIRALAVRFELEWERYGSRVFALSGLGPGCGVSSLALGLGHALGARGRRLLLVECNLRRPGLARAQGALRPGPGLWEALQDEALDLKGLVQWDPRRQVDILPAGEAGEGLADRPAFLRLLARFRDNYDLILLDVAALADDDFAYHVAAHADAVLLVGREDDSLYRDLRQSIDRLVLAEVPAVSAVLNFTQTKRSERILSTIYAQMRWLSRLHWMLHRSLRRILRRLTRRGD